MSTLCPFFYADAFYDAGDLGYAYGPMIEIAAVMKTLERGQTLEVRGTDPAFAVDLTAWCRLAGNEFVAHADDRYLIRYL